MKKLIALLMVLVLAFSLVACGDETGSSNGGASGGTGSTDGGNGGGSTSNSSVLPTAAGELPVVPEGTDVTLTVGVTQLTVIADYNTNYFTEWVKENTGVNLEFVYYPQDTILEKMLLELSSGDPSALPDIYLARSFAGTDTIFMPSYAPRWYNEGMIIPLNDLIDEYGYYYQQVRDVAAAEGYMVEEWMTSADGNMYSLPGFSASLTNSYPHKLWINEGWLDNLGLKIPTTTDEFKDVLTAFKNDDPNGNGQNDEIPFSGAKQLLYYGYDYIINAFIYNQSNFSRIYVEDGEVKFAANTDEWREAMKYLNELNDEGLYYEGSFTQDRDTLTQIALNENDILGVFEGLGHDLILTTTDQDIIDRWTAIPALTGPDGAHYVTWNAPTPGANAVITAGCEYPEIAFRVLDFMMSEEGGLITRYGEKGVNWDDADEGTISYYGTPSILKILENTWSASGQNQNFAQQSPFILDPAIATGIQWDGDEKEAGYIKAKSVMLLDETGIVPDEYIANLVFDLDELESVTTARTDIDNYITQSVANFVAGDWDPNDDAQWNSYVAEYEKMGLENFLATTQKAYDRQKGK